MSSIFLLQTVFDLLKTMTYVTHYETRSSIAPPQQLRRVQERHKQSYHRNRHVILYQRDKLHPGPPASYYDVLSIFKVAAEFKGSVETAHTDNGWFVATKWVLA